MVLRILCSCVCICICIYTCVGVCDISVIGIMAAVGIRFSCCLPNKERQGNEDTEGVKERDLLYTMMMAVTVVVDAEKVYLESIRVI
ncbi:hypothetical protein JOM56_002912 [Amanita muscaria]